MAICGFRADNYPAGLLEGEALHRVLSLLEELSKGVPEEDVHEKDAALLDVLKRSGLVALPEKGLSLSPAGEKLLEACRGLIKPSS